MYKFIDILDARENRVEFQKQLLKKYKKNLIVMRVNYPGLNKDNELTRNIIDVMKKKLICKFKKQVLYTKYYNSAEGPIFLIVVEGNIKDIKVKTIELEEKHILGRCLDIDVYNEEGSSISRKNLGLEGRKCFICNDMAHACTRSEKHSKEDVINFIQKKYDEYLEMEKICNGS